MTWIALLFAPIPPVLLTYFLTRKKIQEVHVLVNSQLTEALNRIVQLELEVAQHHNREGVKTRRDD